MDKDMHSLKEILLDAARYRWFRENAQFFVDDFMVSWDEEHSYVPEMEPEEIDAQIDKLLKAENE